jgi:iduronate 2-sulfatase
MYVRLILIATLMALCLASTALAAKDVHLYFLGGQSNACGRANAADIPASSPLASPQTDVSLWYRNTMTEPKANGLPQSQIVDLAPGSGFGTAEPVYDIEFGPEVAFGRTLADALPDQNIMIVKQAYGGSSLTTSWSSTGERYAEFLETSNDAIDAVTANGDNPVLMGMIWVQGESDAKSSTMTYGADLTDLISRVRTDLFEGADAPFVFSQLSDNQYEILIPGMLSVREGQAWVNDNVDNTAMVVTDGAEFSTIFETYGHFDTTGQISLGTALGNEMVALVPEPATMSLLAIGGIALIRRRKRA